MHPATFIQHWIARLRPWMRPGAIASIGEATFHQLASELFAFQRSANPVYQRLCAARGWADRLPARWEEIPTLPISAFKDYEVSCLAPAERVAVFHSSGTTGQTPSRHFHSRATLELYEASLLPWFRRHFLHGAEADARFLFLTPPPAQAPHSSLVHMFETVRKQLAAERSVFLGHVLDCAWELDLGAAWSALKEVSAAGEPMLLLGTAFSFVHLLDELEARGENCPLPAGSRVMETGGYKGRSRVVPKAELHAALGRRLKVALAQIVSEYGMCELSSQAYDAVTGEVSDGARIFHFPPWARARVISPETGETVANGETGLLQVFDLANAGSVLAIQTEDLAVRRDTGFELLGRRSQAEPRGCSLMELTNQL